MATLKQVLGALHEEAEAISAPDLGKKLGISSDEVRAQLSKLKNKGYAQRDGSGWQVTDEGSEAAEEGLDIPLSPQDVGADARSKLAYYGHLSGVKQDKVSAALEMLMSGDPCDLSWVQECFAKVDVPMEQRKVWLNLWGNYVVKNAPEQERQRAMSVVAQAARDEGASGSPAGKARAAPDSGLDYVLGEEEPVYVGRGMGTLTREEAVALSLARAGRHGSGSQPPQGLGLSDIMTIIDKVKGDTSPAKTYVVSQSPEGTQVQEVESGMPLVVGGSTPPPAPQPAKTYFVNPDGQVQEAAPNEPIVIRQQAPPPPAPTAPPKTYVVDNETGEVRSVEPGEPLVLKPRNQDGAMIPFRDRDGNPVYLDSRNLDPIISWERFKNEERRKEESHEAWVGALGTIRENFGRVAGAIDRMMAERGGEGGGEETASAESKGDLVTGKCPGCGGEVKVPRGTQQFVCRSCDTIVEVQE